MRIHRGRRRGGGRRAARLADRGGPLAVLVKVGFSSGPTGGGSTYCSLLISSVGSSSWCRYAGGAWSASVPGHATRTVASSTACTGTGCTGCHGSSCHGSGCQGLGGEGSGSDQSGAGAAATGGSAGGAGGG